MHYHISQRMNGGEPVIVHTDAHQTCIHAAYADMRESLPMLGYILTEEHIDENTQYLVFHLQSIDSIAMIVESLTVAFTFYACDCINGEIILRRPARHVADQN